MFLSPDAETWDPYSVTYALNEEQLVDSGGVILYPQPRDRGEFEPIEVGEVISEPLDNMVEQVSAYDKFADAVISSSAVVVDYPPSIERLLVTDPIQSQVASISTTLDPECFVYKLNELSARSKISVAVGSTNTNPQDCEIIESQKHFKIYIANYLRT